MADERIITARTLLLKFLELRGLSSQLADWTEERFSENPPRLIRLRRLVAIFRAFDIPWDPASFVRGEFIQPEQPRYAGLFSKLVAQMPKGLEPWQRHRLPEFFAMLFGYREKVNGVLEYFSGLYEATGLTLFAYLKGSQLNQVIQDKLGDIEDILVELISPEAATFTVEQLSKNFGYPKDDLFKIDLDWY
jgi:hypothetical protein